MMENIGDAFERWRQLKTQEDFKTCRVSSFSPEKVSIALQQRLDNLNSFNMAISRGWH